MENGAGRTASQVGKRVLLMTAATANDLVHAAIAEKGRITFAEFMEIALYAPGLGYYMASCRIPDEDSRSPVHHSRESGNPSESSREAARLSKAGPPRDYYTAPHLHAVFGAYIARHVAQVWRKLGEPQRFDVVEMGAGRGILAWDVLNGLRQTAPHCWERTRYRLIDRGSGPNAEQQEALASVAAHRVVTAQALTGPVLGMVLSNELLDALPLHRVRVKNGELQELYVAARGEQLCEVYGDPSCQELEHYVERLGRPPEGWQGEICLAALAWLETVARSLTEGMVLTIDYGATWTELCSARWVGGTLACYYRHGVSKNPYVLIGEQDITAHVNFTALKDYGEAVGLSAVSMQSQAEYLIALGIGQELAVLANQPATAETQRAKRAITDLIWPDGLGGFRVLVQRRDGAQ